MSTITKRAFLGTVKVPAGVMEGIGESPVFFSWDPNKTQVQSVELEWGAESTNWVGLTGDLSMFIFWNDEQIDTYKMIDPGSYVHTLGITSRFNNGPNKFKFRAQWWPLNVTEIAIGVRADLYITYEGISPDGGGDGFDWRAFLEKYGPYIAAGLVIVGVGAVALSGGGSRRGR